MISSIAPHLPALLAVDPAAEVLVLSRPARHSPLTSSTPLDAGRLVTETATDHRPRRMALISPTMTVVSARGAHNHAAVQATPAAVNPSTREASQRALVLGGYGAVGRITVQQLREKGDTAYAAGRDPARADRVLDLRAGAHRAYLEALADVDVVVNASGAEDPDLAVAATDRGVAFVDITATTSYAAALAQLEPAAPVLYDVGLAPGLTSILATALHEAAAPGPIDIALIIGAGERHGPGATEWAYGLLGQFFPDTHGGPQVRNYSQPRTFDLPRMGNRRLYRTDYCDQHLLTQRLGVPVRTYFALDSRPSTASLALLTRIPGAARIAPRRLRLPGSDQWLAAAFGTDPAKVRWAHGRSESLATATVAVLAAHAATGLAPGVHQLSGILDLTDLAGTATIHLGQ
jgi:NAD(P)-dependent dehydrogenase (short-subunit alcohol dehydrogenase family)